MFIIFSAEFCTQSVFGEDLNSEIDGCLINFYTFVLFGDFYSSPRITNHVKLFADYETEDSPLCRKAAIPEEYATLGAPSV